ncbi:MAG: hypothetical protein J6V58_00280 [Clostridia bacterium]|nr:hypothetical protein [Clostridia bacterium]
MASSLREDAIFLKGRGFMRVAVIDLGSNAVRMSIADVKDGKIEILKRYRENVRLSENLNCDMMLKPAPVARTLDALRLFKNYADSFNTEKIVAVATAAMRMAKNKEEITKPLLEMGISLNIIDGLEEARYDFLGVMYTLAVNSCVIMDIGGASTEIIAVCDGEIKGMISMPFGAVSITENYIKNYDETDCTEKAYLYLKEEFKKLDFLNNVKGVPVVALGGTASVVAKIDGGKDEDSYRLTANRTKEIINYVNNMPLQNILKNVIIEKKRADIIKGGFTIAKALIECVNSKEIFVNRSGLREGILYELAR